MRLQMLNVLLREKKFEELRTKVTDIRNLIEKLEEDRILSPKLVSRDSDYVSSVVEMALDKLSLVTESISWMETTSVNQISLPNESTCVFESDGIKLPILKLAIYNGDPKGWRRWWEQFEASVHS